MNNYETAITKIQTLPESLIQEVSDFIDFLNMKQNDSQWQLWILFKEVLVISEAEFGEYLTNLIDYENRLVQGEIKW